jgi:hypothetical protein
MMMNGEEDLNKWHFVEVAPMDGKCDDQELAEFFTTVMATKVKEVESAIVVGDMGALSAATAEKEHGFHLIQWTKKPHTLQTPTKVFGIKDQVAAGQVVCEGVFWSRVDHSNDWYEPQEDAPGKRPKKIVVLLEHVLCGKVCFKPFETGRFEPPTAARVSTYNKYNLAKLIRLGAEEIDFLQVEQLQREGFELSALEKIVKKKKATKKTTKKAAKKGGKKGGKKAAVVVVEEDEEDSEYEDDTWQHPDY